MGKTIRRLWMFHSLDYKAAEAYLNRQAEKGLVLQKISPWGLIAAFTRDESGKKISYSVDGCHGSKEEIRRYIDFAADGGWQKAAEMPGMLIFASKPGERPTPMQTDWREEYRQIRKGLWKYDLPLGIVCLACLWLMFKALAFMGTQLSWDDLGFTATVFFVWLVTLLLLFLRSVWFYIRSETAIRRGKPMKQPGEGVVRFWGIIHIAMVLVFFTTLLIQFGSTVQDMLQDGSALDYAILAFLILIAGVALLSKPKSEQDVQRLKRALTGLCVVIAVLLLAKCTGIGGL